MDSPEVIGFMALFSRLKETCRDDPGALYELAGKDEATRNLCRKLGDVTRDLRESERRRPELFTAPVNPSFLGAWRDFEKRFEREVEHVCLISMFMDFGIFEQWPTRGGTATAKRRDPSEQWKGADNSGIVGAGQIDELVQFAWDRLDPDNFDEELVESIEEGIATWEKLTTGLRGDVRGVLRRRMLIPFLLVPRHVADRRDRPEKDGLYRNLGDAHNAFVFGASFAALAMMRSILEVVLRDHYGTGREKKGLLKRIKLVCGRLPSGVTSGALEDLRQYANTALHCGEGDEEKQLPMAPQQQEMEMVRLLLVLRALIEGAPENPRP